MVTLIKEQPGGLLGKREWWQAGSRTVVVAYGKGRCGVSVSDERRHDVTEAVALQLQGHGGWPVQLIQTIDAFLIEVSPDELMPLLLAIEKK